jgi:hypothetical protein
MKWVNALHLFNCFNLLIVKIYTAVFLIQGQLVTSIDSLRQVRYLRTCMGGFFLFSRSPEVHWLLFRTLHLAYYRHVPVVSSLILSCESLFWYSYYVFRIPIRLNQINSKFWWTDTYGVQYQFQTFSRGKYNFDLGHHQYFSFFWPPIGMVRIFRCCRRFETLPSRNETAPLVMWCLWIFRSLRTSIPY